MSQQLIEKLVKKFKTHHAVVDFDNRFVVAIVKTEHEGLSERNLVPYYPPYTLGILRVKPAVATS